MPSVSVLCDTETEWNVEVFVDAGQHHPDNCMISYARHIPIPQAPVPGVPPFCSGEKEEECGSPVEA